MEVQDLPFSRDTSPPHASAKEPPVPLKRVRVIALAFVFVSLAVVLAVDEWRAMHVLFIGNSYTYVNNLPQMIADLARAGHQRPLKFDMETPGGYTLEQHWTGGKAATKIAARHWDFVVLQEQSMRPLDNPKLMFDYAARLDSEIKKQGVRTLLYQTWARQAVIGRQEELNKAYLDLGRVLNACVVPVGMAWEGALGDDPQLALYSADKSHPTMAGTYLAACVFYATIYDKSPEGLPGKIGGLGNDEAKRLQVIAWKTVHQLAGAK